MLDIQPVEWLRWSGLIAIVIAFLSGLFVIFKYPRQNTASISALIALRPVGFFLMAIMLTITATTFQVFLSFWLIPTYDLPAFMYGVIGVSEIAVLFLAWSKESIERIHSISHRVHVISGLIVSTAMIILLTTLLVSYKDLPELSQGALILTWIYSLLFVALGLYRKQSYIRRHMLWYEMGFILLFWITIICMTYKI